jgi:hypothetical protein
MPKPRTDKFCTRIDVCVSNEINVAIECYQAERFLKGDKLRKVEAAEKWIEMIFNHYKLTKRS